MTAIIREEFEPLPPTTPAPLRWIVERLLAKDPAERYDSTRDYSASFARCESIFRRTRPQSRFRRPNPFRRPRARSRGLPGALRR